MASISSNDGFILNGLRQNVLRFLKENKLVTNPEDSISRDSYEGNEGRQFTFVEAIKGVAGGFITLIKSDDDYTGYVEIDHSIKTKYRYEGKQWKQVPITNK